MRTRCTCVPAPDRSSHPFVALHRAAVVHSGGAATAVHYCNLSGRRRGYCVGGEVDYPAARSRAGLTVIMSLANGDFDDRR
jgi:hypothetical protein